ncbi:MAG TPA: Gfo/Idh/MocA family oxidoreductase [Mucilaginibacter sp.]|nr:Gfo/Idh/MocA family oxidoreductase [Mucilaginibacter sp.]
MSSRRDFLQKSAMLAGGAMLASAIDNRAFAIFKNRVMPSDQLNIGAIGINGMGWTDTMSALKIPGVNLVAICDVDKNVMDRRMKDLAKAGYDATKVRRYDDYQSLLDRKDIDAVIIGTPDHWHAMIMMHACEAGKDVYVEKPVGNSIGECEAMVKAQQRYNRVVQAGQWQRSQQHFKDAVDFVQSGQLGNIRTVKVWCYLSWARPAAVIPDSAPPPGVNYAGWLGPAKTVPFNANRFHFNFRWFWDYAGGLMTDWGVHLLDYGLLGMNSPTPKSVSAAGGRFAYPDLFEETPDTLTTVYEFDGFNMVWDSALGIDNGSYGRQHGIAYIGNNGTLILNREGWEVIEESANKNKVSKPYAKVQDDGVDKHWENFVSVVKSRKMEDLHCPIQAGAHVATVAQMGNIAYRSGEKLHWNAAANSFTDNAINKQYLMKEYHNGYKLPKV